MQSVLITTNFVKSNPAHGELYSIQHYMITFVSGLRQVGGFLLVLRFSFTNKTDRHDIVELSSKVALNTITLIFIRSGHWCLVENFLIISVVSSFACLPQSKLKAHSSVTFSSYIINCFKLFLIINITEIMLIWYLNNNRSINQSVNILVPLANTCTNKIWFHSELKGK
jgi:hypothetical protein